MKELTSRQNVKIVETARLKERKYREEANNFLIEGSVMLFDALRSGFKVESVFVLNTADNLISKLMSYENKFNLFLVSKEVLNYISDTVSPKELVAVIKRNDKDCGNFNKILILDNVQDPGNMGTIIRTCACFGLEKIYAVNCVDAFNPKCIRSTKSGIFHVSIFESTYEQVRSICNLYKLTVISADFGGVSLFDFKVPENFALVIGNEANGISQTMREFAAETVTIPMKPDMESLNAGVSAGIILYNFLGKGV